MIIIVLVVIFQACINHLCFLLIIRADFLIYALVIHLYEGCSIVLFRNENEKINWWEEYVLEERCFFLYKWLYWKVKYCWMARKYTKIILTSFFNIKRIPINCQQLEELICCHRLMDMVMSLHVWSIYWVG